MTKGIFAYDFGDKSGMTPLLKMDTLGHDFIPPGIHAGGLRYHGMSPLVSLFHREGIVEAVSYPQLKCFEAALTFARAEGLIVAPETSHAICCVVDEALKAKEEGKEKTILFNLSGHGHFDMAAYEKYFAGELSDYEYPEAKIREALAHLPKASSITNFSDVELSRSIRKLFADLEVDGPAVGQLHSQSKIGHASFPSAATKYSARLVPGLRTQCSSSTPEIPRSPGLKRSPGHGSSLRGCPPSPGTPPRAGGDGAGGARGASRVWWISRKQPGVHPRGDCRQRVILRKHMPCWVAALSAAAWTRPGQ